MRKVFRYPLVAVALAFAVTSCKKNAPDQAKYIPKDAMFVLDLNWKSLSDKASKGNFNWDSLFKAAATEPGDDSDLAKGKREFENFIHSGVDTTSNVFFFTKTGGSIMSGQSTTGGVVMDMKDPSKFESYVKQHDNAPSIKKGDGFSYATLHENVYVGWNKNVVILSWAQQMNKFGGSGNSSSNNFAADQQTLSALFNQKEDESLASVPEFRDLMEEQADMLFWTNSSSMFNAVPLLGLTKFADLFKDSYGAGSVNFEDGKAVANYRSYSGKDLADILKKYAGPTADMNLVNKYPYPVEGFAAFSFKPEIFSEIIKYGGMESTVNQYFEKLGFTMDDVTKAFKGDFAIVFSDIATAEKELDYNGMKMHSNKPSAKLVFTAAIGDKAAYDKIASKLADQGIMEMKNGQYVPQGMGDEFAWNMDGKTLTIATDSELMQQYLSGHANAMVPRDIADEAKDKAVIFYVDINKILQGLSTSGDTKTVDAAKATFKNGVATSTNFNGKYMESRFELNTVNNNENSLVSLIKFFASVSQKIEREQEKLRNGMMNMDSTMPTPPTPPTTPEDDEK
jgi:hypothetical protein